ncbi:hypothetical protein [Comamonas resistens]|uniref:Uncharacterized protein n=1 Tax=Comamonas resistens TaxID=3046670 RepID=A0ABY8SMV9_9BURK|nr:hypothetical protein [Comamonas resistens]MDL5038581.1 hypothetical protein [Comamonas resistens]WHS64065.1 hypothetical protein QMY55_16340 [Comamonas resistens]
MKNQEKQLQTLAGKAQEARNKENRIYANKDAPGLCLEAKLLLESDLHKS